MPWEGLNWGGLALASYLIGTIPTAYLATRLLKAQDIRRLGDNNAGAANVFRSVGRSAGILVFAVDVGKGVAVVLLARWWLDSVAAPMLAGVSAVAGHNWPVYLQLRGGRGAATGTGVLLALVPWAAAPLSLLSLVVLFLTKSTVKALACLFVPLAFIAWLLDYSPSLVLFSIGLPVLVGISHYLSIRRKPMPAAPTYTRPA
ncbi:MAG TPA: glycerol-3-phosphate acyltransferase [Dehalococcoidia bacterium]|nr:glycerol-3-phosphate acyltransferase [Dehalococcoidia bacterium]